MLYLRRFRGDDAIHYYCRLPTWATAPACLYKSFIIQELLKEAWGCCIYVVLEVIMLSIITSN
jgi:hypothetical protein